MFFIWFSVSYGVGQLCGQIGKRRRRFAKFKEFAETFVFVFLLGAQEREILALFELDLLLLVLDESLYALLLLM